MMKYDILNNRLFGGKMRIPQIEGIAIKLSEMRKAGISDKRWIAYMLATSYHETAGRMQPIEEFGKGRGKRYGLKVKYSGDSYDYLDKIYYGRGDVQLTWYENYEKMGKLFDLPLLEKPELMLRPDISAKVMIEGMTKGKSFKGDFTGVSLENYFNSTKDDPINARKIINGLDKAKLIAGYYFDFLNCLR